MKVWRMDDKVSDVAEKVKLRRNSSWKDSSGKRFGFGYGNKRIDRSEVNNELTWSGNDKLISFA